MNIRNNPASVWQRTEESPRVPDDDCNNKAFLSPVVMTGSDNPQTRTRKST
jgi:hypothetical protein